MIEIDRQVTIEVHRQMYVLVALPYYEVLNELNLESPISYTKVIRFTANRAKRARRLSMLLHLFRNTVETRKIYCMASFLHVMLLDLFLSALIEFFK